jgi:rubrerythrin
MTSPLRALNVLFLKQLLRSPRGRAYFFAQLAEVEGADEVRIFEQLERLTQDPELQRMIRRHAADERRHAELLEERVRSTRAPRPRVPRELNVLTRIDALVGRLSQPPANREEAALVYALLQVIEERVAEQYALYVEALRDVDPESAEILETIRRDEELHLRYCRAITQRLGAPPQVLDEELKRYRAAEAYVFLITNHDVLRHILREGLLEQPWWVRAAWLIASTGVTALTPKPRAFTRWAPPRPALTPGTANLSAAAQEAGFASRFGPLAPPTTRIPTPAADLYLGAS